VSYRLRTSRRAGRQIREAAAWWSSNRDKAPFAFAEDLDDALHLIAELPKVGEPVQHVEMTGVRRLLLTRTRYHLYYRVAEDTRIVEVLTLWHTSRARPPKL
jgi:plasmid stabilization system protein ParE